MGVAGDIVQALIGAVPGLGDELDGSQYAPVPTVGSRPGTVAGARAWYAPSASGSGQVSVHRDVLRSVATGMHSDLADLDGAVSRLNGVRRGDGISITSNASLIAGWSTAVAFNANASAAFTGVMRASQQTGTAHQAASTGLTSSAAAYDQSESDNQRAVRSVGTNLYSVTGLVASYGSGKPVSSVLGSQPSYPVKTRAVASFSGAGMSTDTIMDILHSLSPGEVQDAAAAHTYLGSVLDTVATRLAGNAGTLSKNWSGSAAEAAMGQFQQLHTRMSALAQQTTQVGSVLSWLGNHVLPQFANLPDPRTSLTSLVVGGAVSGAATGGVTGAVVGAGAGLLDDLDGQAQAAANTAAQQYIARLSGYLVTADQSLPQNIGATPPPAAGSGRSGSAPAVPGVGSAARTGSGTGPGLTGTALTSVSRISTRSSSSTSKTTGTTVKAVGPIKTISTGTPAGQPGGTVTAPSGLQGATIPGGQLSSTPAGSVPTPGTSAPVGPGGLSGNLPGSVPTIGGNLPGTSQESLGAAAETLDDATVPNVSQVAADSVGPDSAGIAAETLDDVTVPNVSQVGADSVGADSAAAAAETLDDVTVPEQVGASPAGASAEMLGDEVMPGIGQAGVADDIAPEASGMVTGLDESEPLGLGDATGISSADSPTVGEVIGGQSARLDAEDPLADPEGAAAVPDDMDGFPMMGGGGAGRQDEQERLRQAWLHEDDLWRSSADVVPPVIASDK